MIKGLIATMWTHIERISPDILHTHDYNTIRIGKEFVNRLRKTNKRIFWIHDFHEYHEFVDNHSNVDYRMNESLPFLYKALID